MRHNSPYNFEFNFLDTHLGPHSVTAIPDETLAVCVFVNDKLDAAIINTLAEKGVKVIALRCAGFNNVDLESAKANGILVCRVPAYSPEAVAEHSVAMLLTLVRKTHKAYNRVREQNFSLNGLMGFNLNGKTVGVIGTGKIGKAFCKIMLGFGCKVIANDPFPDPQLTALRVNYLSLEELLRQSDIISLHCPLTPENRHLIDAKALGIVKKGVTIINTSRGALLDTPEIIKSLKDGTIGNLGIDVYEQEEHLFFKDLSGTIIDDDVIQRLISFPNVFITEHQAFLTVEALDQIAEITLSSVTSLLLGRKPENENVLV